MRTVPHFRFTVIILTGLVLTFLGLWIAFEGDDRRQNVAEGMDWAFKVGLGSLLGFLTGSHAVAK